MKNCDSGKCLFGEISVRGKVIRETVHWGNIRPGNFPFGELPFGKLSVGKMLGKWGKCPVGNCPSGKSPSGKCPLGNCPYLFIFEILEIQFIMRYEESEAAIHKY